MSGIPKGTRVARWVSTKMKARAILLSFRKEATKKGWKRHYRVVYKPKWGYTVYLVK